MAYIIRVRTYEPEWRGHVTSIYKRGFFGDKLLYKYVICPVRFEIPGIEQKRSRAAIAEWQSRYEVRTIFQLLFSYKW
jgi:hypothetical protein